MGTEVSNKSNFPVFYIINDEKKIHINIFTNIQSFVGAQQSR